MKGIRIVRLVYADCRGVAQQDISSYVEGVRETFGMDSECQEDQAFEVIFIPVRSETRIEHVVLDLEQVKIAKVMEYIDVEELRRQYPGV